MKQVMYVVDEDILFCNRIASLFASTSFAVKTFECAEDFLKQSHPIAPGCFLIINSDVYAFTFGQKGLMAGLGLQGSKITKID